MTPPQRSRRFKPSRLAARLVPVLLVILALALLVTIIIVVLSVVGVMPGR